MLTLRRYIGRRHAERLVLGSILLSLLLIGYYTYRILPIRFKSDELSNKGIAEAQQRLTDVHRDTEYVIIGGRKTPHLSHEEDPMPSLNGPPALLASWRLRHQELSENKEFVQKLMKRNRQVKDGNKAIALQRGNSNNNNHHHHDTNYRQNQMLNAIDVVILNDSMVSESISNEITDAVMVGISNMMKEPFVILFDTSNGYIGDLIVKSLPSDGTLVAMPMSRRIMEAADKRSYDGDSSNRNIFLMKPFSSLKLEAFYATVGLANVSIMVGVLELIRVNSRSDFLDLLGRLIIMASKTIITLPVDLSLNIANGDVVTGSPETIIANAISHIVMMSSFGLQSELGGHGVKRASVSTQILSTTSIHGHSTRVLLVSLSQLLSRRLHHFESSIDKKPFIMDYVGLSSSVDVHLEENNDSGSSNVVHVPFYGMNLETMLSWGLQRNYRRDLLLSKLPSGSNNQRYKYMVCCGGITRLSPFAFLSSTKR